MVGEIRDLETAEIAIQAALTGHLMLSTIIRTVRRGQSTFRRWVCAIFVGTIA